MKKIYIAKLNHVEIGVQNWHKTVVELEIRIVCLVFTVFVLSNYCI